MWKSCDSRKVGLMGKLELVVLQSPQQVTVYLVTRTLPIIQMTNSALQPRVSSPPWATLTGMTAWAAAPASSWSTRGTPSRSTWWTGGSRLWRSHQMLTLCSGVGHAPRDGLTSEARPGARWPAAPRLATCTGSGARGSRVRGSWHVATFRCMSSRAVIRGTPGSR